jgi:hypothetical protein
MTEQSGTRVSPTGAAFAEHLRAFHGGLPAEEKPLMEQLLALAEAATQNDEVRGYAYDAFLKLEGIKGESSYHKYGADIKLLFAAGPTESISLNFAKINLAYKE